MISQIEPSGYGKRLEQLTSAEMAWWFKHGFRPVAGGAYLCRRGSKEHGTVAGKIYLFNGSELLCYTTRTKTVLLNGYNTLRQPYAFEPSPQCPICFSSLSCGGHDVMACAEKSA